MLEINKKILFFKIKEIWFADKPFDVDKFHSVLFRACKRNLDVSGFEKKEFNTLIIDLNQDLNKIWENMDKSSCRYSVNRAEKQGLIIKINQNYKDFYQINRLFRKKKKLSQSFSWNLELMEKYGTLFVAEFKGEIIAGCLFLEDKDNIRWLFGASKRLQADKTKATLIGNANHLIIWQAIKYAKAKTIKEFDFGGYYLGQDKEKERINRFKKSFGGKLATHYIYEKFYSKLLKILWKTIKK